MTQEKIYNAGMAIFVVGSVFCLTVIGLLPVMLTWIGY